MTKLIACSVICCGILLAQGGLPYPGQSAALDRLKADIGSLAKPGLTSTEKLADDMMALTETPQPPRSVVQAFAAGLTRALAMGQISAAVAIEWQPRLSCAVPSGHLSTWRNLEWATKI